jgi:outer membrane protein assembly factor BamD (BamD/ComL family)
MADYDDYDANGLNGGRLAAAAMAVGGGLCAVITTLWSLARFWELSRQAQPLPALSEFLGTAALLLVGWALGLLLWGGAELLRRLEALREALRTTTRGSASAGLADSLLRGRAADAHSEQQAHMLEELVHLTRELRDIELLSESERAARLAHESAELVRQLEHDVPVLLREHNLHEAQQRLQRARRRFPSLPNWDALEKQIEQARAKFESHDLNVATREVEDLAALGAWDRAVEIVRTLRQRHPTSEKVAELTKRIAIARDKATAEERARLMSQAQAASSRRDWSEALRLVEALLARFPGSAEAQELRTQLPTLKTNAEIQKRQEMENAIRDLVRQQHFTEALRIAHELVNSYPDSPQAHALREQIPRLEQRAAELARP